MLYGLHALPPFIASYLFADSRAETLVYAAAACRCCPLHACSNAPLFIVQITRNDVADSVCAISIAHKSRAVQNSANRGNEEYKGSRRPVMAEAPPA